MGLGKNVLDKQDAFNALRLDRSKPPEPSGGSDVPWRLLFGVAGLLVLLFLGGLAWWYVPLLSSAPVQVHTVTVASQGGGAQSGGALNASGYVVAEQQATVAAQVTGMITAVYVQEGEHVTAGQVLARLDDSAAKASVASASSQLAADEALIPQYESGLVKDSRELERAQRLAAQGALSQSTLDAAVAAVSEDRAQLAHAQALVQVDRKVLDLNNTLLSYTVITAPFDGVITERYAHPGEMISPQAVGGFTQTGIAKLVDMHSLEIDVDIAEAYITRVQTGQRVDAVLDAYPDWHVPAHVTNVVPTANQQKATVKVRIGFDRYDPRILPQMGVQVWFAAIASASAAPSVQTLQIPASAVHGRAPDTFVYRVADGRAHLVAVRVAPGAQGTMRVLAGLIDGDRIVTSATGPLADGDVVGEQ